MVPVYIYALEARRKGLVRGWEFVVLRRPLRELLLFKIKSLGLQTRALYSGFCLHLTLTFHHKPPRQINTLAYSNAFGGGKSGKASILSNKYFRALKRLSVVAHVDAQGLAQLTRPIA